MATGEIGKNLTFPIFNSDGTSFNDLVLHKATYDSVVMSLGVKITGDVYYRGTDLPVTMSEYIEYDDIKFVLVSPPVIVREGMVSDNSELKGLTKYSFTFYHPMYMLANFPFSDVAVSNDQKKYLSSNRSFSWIGNLEDFVAKINKNLYNTQWYCDISGEISASDRKKLSDVIAFDKNTIADAIKKGYEIWKLPYIISRIKQGEPQYSSGKRFLIRFGLPTTEIVVDGSPFVFEYGQGVGLKNNSRTPRNNKIITRLSGYGSEDNIPYGYPQIRWYGNQSWNYTVNNNPSAANSYPIYDGILGGQKVRLIKHPFTRTHLMPSVYVNSLFNKISQYLANGNANPNYDPTLELVDYYDADNTYVNPIVADSPSYEIHEFEGIKPELQSRQISSVGTYDDKYNESVTMGDFLDLLKDFITQSQYDKEKEQLEDIKNGIGSHDSDSGSVTPQGSDEDARLYSCQWSYHKDNYYAYVKYESVGQNFEYVVRLSNAMPTPDWDDTMDDDGNYVQSYFTMTLPALGFDLYACAAITQQMSINMRSGACIGCTFPVAVDWEDYKMNFYDENGDFDPVIGTGHPRNGDKYPDSTSSAITVVVQKDLNTFGTLMPNIYQKPVSGDDFVILGISLPVAYVTSAEQRLDDDMKQYMRDNNVYYFDYPFKFDEAFLATHTDILQQMKPNVVVRFKYNGETLALYIKQMSIKFGDKPLPEYNITLTDDVEIVLNDIGKVSEEVSNLRILMGEGDGGGGLNDKRYLRKDKDDTAQGFITFMKGFQVGGQFVTGLLGEGGIFRKDADGTTYIEADKLYIRMKAFFDTVEVRRFIHSGGNRIASAAGIKCSRVEWLTSNSEVTDNINNVAKFRCYFRANDDGKQITNDFVANDLAYCKETNINVSQGLSQRFYWRKVVGVSSSVNADGEHYIDISKSDCLSGSDYPLAQDDIIQLGNTTDTTRQGAIVEYVSGEDAPSYQIYQRINTYSLENKNYVSLGYKSDTGHAYINVYGDAFIGDPNRTTYIEYKEEGQGGLPELNVKANVTFTSPTTHQDTTLEDFATAVVGDLDSLQQQIDGSIETWFYDYMPVEEDEGAPANTTPLVTRTVSGQKVPVYPYYDWFIADGGDPTTTPVTQPTSTTERSKHLGDTFYDNTSGYAFRFSNTGTAQSPTFAWVVIQDSAVIKALADAAKAQDTADHKRRAFVLPITIGSTTYNYPYPPYDVGDLWLNAKYPYNYDGATDVENDKYNNDVLRCITPQGENGSFSIDHWVLASKYTDDSTVNAFINSYGTILGITPTAQGVGQALGYLDKVLSTGSTQIDGGLVLTNILYMKDTANTPSVRAGISGLYKSSETGTGYKGHGTAAWFGGGVSNGIPIDHEVSTSASDYAKIIFRFDGSGYLAGSNISWNENGAVTIKDITTLYSSNNTDILNELTLFSNAFHFNTTAGTTTVLGIIPQVGFTKLDISRGSEALSDTSVLNRGENDARYVRIDFFNRLFQAYKSSTISDENKVAPNDITTTINNLKIMVGTWTEQYLTSLGHGSGGSGGSATLYGLLDVKPNDVTTPSRVYGLDGTSSDNGKVLTYSTTYNKWVASTVSAGGGGVDMSAVWAALNAATSEQINASHLTNALSGYVQASALANYLPIAGGTLTGEVITSSPITINGYNGRTFGITPTSSGHQGDNVDVGWNWVDKDGAGAFFRSTDANSNPGSFGFYARNSAGTTKEFIGKPDGSLTWGNDNILHTGNFATEVGASLFTALTSTNATNLSVTIGGTTKTITNLYALRLKGVQVKEDTVSYGDLNSLVGTSYSVVTNYNTNNSWQHAPTIQTGNYWGGAIVVKGQDSNLMMQLFWNAKHNESTTPTGKLWFRARTSGGWGDDWKEIAFVDGNIATATALATARTIWGRPFAGTDDVSGNMTDVGTITGNGNITVTKTTTADTMVSVINSNGTVRLYTSANRGLYDGTSGSTGWIIATNGTNTWMSRGNVGIGTTTPSYKLHVSGVAAAQSFRSTVETGTAPMVVASSTLVTNLNADLLDGKHASDFATASDMTTLQGYFDASGNARNALRLTTVSKTAWGQTYWTANGVPTNISGDMTSVGSITLTNNSRISNATGSGGSLYIGRADDAGWVKMSDMCSRQGDSFWKIKSNGDATFGNVYSNGALTCLTGSSTSDARKKMIVGQVDLSVESIAKMPTIKFLWKHIPDKTVQVGTLAQSWQNVLPEAVTENDGVLGFQYGVAALMSAIVTARKVVDHEKRIAQLEKENMELRNELNKIKAA